MSRDARRNLILVACAVALVAAIVVLTGSSGDDPGADPVPFLGSGSVATTTTTTTPVPASSTTVTSTATASTTTVVLPSDGGAATITQAICDALRSAGAGPIRRGQEGYTPLLDPDNNGVACD